MKEAVVKFGVIVLIFVLLGVIGFAGYTAYKTTTLSQERSLNSVASFLPNNPRINPTNSTSPSVSPGMTSVASLSATLSVVHAGVNPKYTLSVPSDWSVNHTSTAGSPPTDTLIISRDNFQLKIYQGIIRKLICLDKNDPITSSANVRLKIYIITQGTVGDILEEGYVASQSGNLITSIVCAKESGASSFSSPTRYGDISFTTKVSTDSIPVVDKDTFPLYEMIKTIKPE